MKRVLKSRLRRRVLVSCKSGDAFRGIWFDGDQEAIVLRDAEHIQPNTERLFVPADGEIVVLVNEIAYLQFL